MVDSVIPNDPNKLQPIQLDPIERQAFEQQSQEQRWMEFNQQVIPTTFQEMLSSSFDMAYQHGLGRKTYNLATRLTNDAPKVPAKELNERYKTDMFKYDVSEEQANDLLALVKRKAELGRIIESGDGSFWGDKVPWFAGSMAGWFVDPTSIPTMIAGNAAGSYATKLAAQIGTTAVKAKIAGYATESITTGLLQATGSQALAPEALEERSAKQFAIDMGTGMVGDAVFLGLGAAGKRMLKAMAKAKPDQGDLGNKAMASTPQKNASIQAYAQEAFKNGAKIDAEKLVRTPDTKVKASAKETAPDNTVYVRKTSDGDVIDSSIADKKSLEATGDLDSIADGTGQAIAVTIPKEAKIFDVKADQGGFLNLFKKFVSDRNKQKYTAKVGTVEVPRIPDPDDMVNVYHATDANFFDFDPDLANALVSFHDIKRKAENYGRDHIHQRQILKSQTLDLYRPEGGISAVTTPEKWDEITSKIVTDLDNIAGLADIGIIDEIDTARRTLNWYNELGTKAHPIVRLATNPSSGKVNPNDLASFMKDYDYYTLSSNDAASLSEHLAYAKIIADSLEDGSSNEVIVNRLADLTEFRKDVTTLADKFISKLDEFISDIKANPLCGFGSRWTFHSEELMFRRSIAKAKDFDEVTLALKSFSDAVRSAYDGADSAILDEVNALLYHLTDTINFTYDVHHELLPQAHEDLWRLYYGLVDKFDRVSKQILFGGLISGAVHAAEISKDAFNGSRAVNRILVENGLDAVLIGHGGATGRHYMLSEIGLKATRSEEVVSQIQTKFGEFFNLIDELQKGGLDSPSIANVMKAKDPELYGEFMDYMREQGYSVVDFGDRKLVLNPELLPNEEVKLNKEMLEPAGGKEELSAKLTSEEMDMEYNKEALDSVGKANEAMGPEVSRNFDEEATGLLNELSTNEGESSIIKQDVETLKEEMKVHSHVETAIKAFVSCVLKG